VVVGKLGRDVETGRKPSTGLKPEQNRLEHSFVVRRDREKTQHGIETEISASFVGEYSVSRQGEKPARD